jgi:Domain of unknown function (DUF397)
VTSNREERGTRPGGDLSRAMWRKSSYSGGNGSCVEVAHLDRAVAVRDSKDPGGPALTFTRDEWKNFTAKVRTTALGS